MEGLQVKTCQLSCHKNMGDFSCHFKIGANDPRYADTIPILCVAQEVTVSVEEVAA